MLMNYVLLYVEDVPASRDFYAALLDREPVENSPGFALFALPTGVKFGLWKRADVRPEVAKEAAARCEIGFPVDTDADVDRIANEWTSRGVTIAQPPETMDFGRTFTALDLDGHRLRVMHVSA